MLILFVLWIVLLLTASPGGTLPPPAASDPLERGVRARQAVPRRDLMPAAPDPLERGLVSHWIGDGNALDTKERNNGTLYGGVTYAPAMVGQGFRFNGTDGAVNVPDNESLHLTDSLTIAAWVYIEKFPDPNQGAAMLLFRGDTRGGLDPYTLQINAARRLVFTLCPPNNQGLDLSAPIAVQRFIHIAAVLNGATGRVRLYENGELVAGTTSNIGALVGELDPNAQPGVGIGNHARQGEVGFHYPFCGIINDLRVYSRSLTAQEVRLLFRRTFAVRN